ncbi:hypothetical protein ACLKA6_016620 [Drosophila palustris]
MTLVAPATATTAAAADAAAAASSSNFMPHSRLHFGYAKSNFKLLPQSQQQQQQQQLLLLLLFCWQHVYGRVLM